MDEKPDPCSYKGFIERHSKMLAAGVTLIFLGCSFSSFASLLPSFDQADSAVIAKALDEMTSLATKDVVHTDFASAHVLATMILLAFVIVGAWILGRARNDLKDFQEAYPVLENGIAQDESRRLVRSGHKLIAAAVVVIGASMAFGIANHVVMTVYADLASADTVSRASALGTGTVMFGFAIGFGLLVRGIALKHAPDQFRYDFRSIGRMSVYEVDKQTQGDLNSRLRHVRRIVARKSLANHIIIIAGILVSLGLYALPSLHTPLFWLGIFCAGIACWLVNELSLKHARRLFSDAGEHL